VRSRAVLVPAAILALFLAAPPATAGQRGHSFVLTALADQGTVYWRPCTRKGWSLGFRIWNKTATAGVTFRAGSLTRRRTLQPGEPTVWFPFTKNRVQRLSVVSGGEAETIFSHVTLEFDEAHSLPSCFPYAPPRVSVSLYGKTTSAEADAAASGASRPPPPAGDCAAPELRARPRHARPGRTLRRGL
jgi:hypothetical protein